MYTDQEKLKNFFLDSGLVSEKDLIRAEKKSAREQMAFSKALIDLKAVSPADLRQAEAYVLGIPFVNLKENKKIDYEVLSLIPEPVARTHHIVSYKKTGDTLEVAMLDTDDLASIDFVKKKVGLKVLPRLTDEEGINNALRQYQKSLQAEFGDVIQKEAKTLNVALEKEGEEVDPDELKKLAEDLPVVRIVDTLLSHAITQNASDIHIEPMEKEVLVRYRIDGILHDAMTLPRNAAPGITARIKVLSGLKLDEKRLPQDGRFKIDIRDQKVSFRVSTLPTYYGEKTVMRLLREDSKGFTLEELGFHGVALERVHSAMKQTTGMILATGPTGSGKTTTLYTVLELVNSPEVNISTIEDPVEYQMERINQTQVKPDIGFAFTTGLRALVRQDPDIIMVGEIRDGETASLAVNAALTGHLVLSTLHTNSAAGAIPRLIDMKVEPFLLVSTVKVVVAQRLVRRLCRVKEKYTLSTEEVGILSKNINMDYVLEVLKKENVIGPKDDWKDIPFYHPKKSPECEEGYAGRMGIHEVLSMSKEIKDLVIKGSTTDDIEAQARKEGMMTMLEDGVFKAAQGLTTIEEVLRVISE